MSTNTHTWTRGLCVYTCWCHDCSLEVQRELLFSTSLFQPVLLCTHWPCVFACVCVCFSDSTHLAWALLGPSIQTAGCLFRFAIANTPLGLSSALRAIPGSGLSLAQACCLAHWRSLQANLSPTRIQEDPNHNAPPSHHSETLAASTRLALRVSVCVSCCVSFLFDNHDAASPPFLQANRNGQESSISFCDTANEKKRVSNERWKVKEREAVERKKTTKVVRTKAVLYHWNDLWVESLKSHPQSQVIKPRDRLGSRSQSQTGLAVEPGELPVTGDVKINLLWKR